MQLVTIKFFLVPQDVSCAGGQRIQIISAQGHEIILLDAPSGMSKIQITTSDGSQQIVMDEIGKKFYIGVADKDAKIIVESDAEIEIKSRQKITLSAPEIEINGNTNITGDVKIKGKYGVLGEVNIKGDLLVNGLVKGDLDDGAAGVDVSVTSKYDSITNAIKKEYDQHISHPPIDPVSREKCKELLDKQLKSGIINPDQFIPFDKSYKYTSEESKIRDSYINTIKDVDTKKALNKE